MIGELQHQDGSGNDIDKKNVLEMLQRVEEPEDLNWDDDLDSDDESESGDLAERLADVDLNNADAVWERLTDEEKQDFKSIVYNGEIEKIVQPVEPWWQVKLEDKLIRDVETETSKVDDILKQCPKVQKDIKNFQKISTKTPAPCIIHNIANVIAAYAFIFRYYNGDHINYELEATDNLISICDNLKANANFESMISVTDAVVMSCLSFNLLADKSSKEIILEDLRNIFNGPGDDTNANAFILSSLSDILTLFRSAKGKTKEGAPSSAGTSRKFSAEFVSGGDGRSEFKQLENQTHFVGMIRKIEFYLSFIKFRYNCSEWIVQW